MSSPSPLRASIDDDADPPLRGEAAAEHDEIERGVGATRELDREAVVQHGEREHVDGRAEAIQAPTRARFPEGAR